MPCDSSHCEHNQREIESARVLTYLTELGLPVGGSRRAARW